MDPADLAKPTNLGELLRREKESIVREWERRVLSDPGVPEANRLPEPVLRDHIPLFLDSLAISASQTVPRHFVTAEGMLPFAHARQRYAEAYSLRSALREWSHFRSTLMDVIGEAGLPWSAGARRVLDEVDAAMVTGASAMHEATLGSRIKMEAERNRTLALFESLITTVPVGLAFVDASMRYVRVNAALAAISGVPISEMEGHAVSEVAPALAKIIEPQVAAVFETGVPRVDVAESGSTWTSGAEVSGWPASYYPVREPLTGVIFAVQVLVGGTEQA